jgi:hypothetical protein
MCRNIKTLFKPVREIKALRVDICAVALVLTMASLSAAAEWVKVAQTPAAAYYVDNANLARSDGKVKIWQLIDLAANSSAPDAQQKNQSSIGQREYDCIRGLFKGGYTVDYSGSMGSGPPLRSIIGSTIWAPVAPGSTDALMAAFACGKP